MLDDLQEMFRYAARDALSLVVDWRLYVVAGIFAGAILAATYLDHGFDPGVVTLVLAFVAIAVGVALAILRWPEQRERREWVERQRRELAGREQDTKR